MTKKINGYFHLMWPLMLYIVIEIVFQIQVRKTMVDFNGDSLNMLEWWGRFMFAAAMGLFSFYLLNRKTLSYIIAVVAFLFASNIYTVVTKVLPETTRSNIEQNFVWAYRVGDLSNKRKIFDIMTIYKDQNTQKREEFQVGSHQYYQQYFTDAQLHKFYMEIQDAIIKQKRAQSGGSVFMMEETTLETLSPHRFNMLKEKANSKFSDVARTRLHIDYLNNPHPLGNMVPLESGEESFKKAILLWVDQEMASRLLKDKAVTLDKMNEAAIMLPVALFFSSIGILLNSAILIFYSFNVFVNDKIAALSSLGYLSMLTVVGIMAQTSIPFYFSGIIPIINVIGWV